MKRSFFQAAVTSILLYGCTTWTLTKRLEKKLDGNYTRMLRAILNKSWQQHPTRHQLYGHLPPITKTIQVRRTRHAGHCWRSRDELIRDVLLWIPTHGRAKAGRPARTYIQQLCEDTGCCPEDLPRAMNDREEWRERVRDIRTASTIWWWWWYIYIYICIYIYAFVSVCVCVCVCVCSWVCWFLLRGESKLKKLLLKLMCISESLLSILTNSCSRLKIIGCLWKAVGFFRKRIVKVNLATVVEGNTKAPFSIATTPRCRGGRYYFPCIAQLDRHLIMLSVKQGGIKYHFLNLWYDSTWDWTRDFRAIGKNSNSYANTLHKLVCKSLMNRFLSVYLAASITAMQRVLYENCLIK